MTYSNSQEHLPKKARLDDTNKYTEDNSLLSFWLQQSPIALKAQISNSNKRKKERNLDSNFTSSPKIDKNSIRGNVLDLLLDKVHSSLTTQYFPNSSNENTQQEIEIEDIPLTPNSLHAFHTIEISDSNVINSNIATNDANNFPQTNIQKKSSKYFRLLVLECKFPRKENISGEQQQVEPRSLN